MPVSMLSGSCSTISQIGHDPDAGTCTCSCFPPCIPQQLHLGVARGKCGGVQVETTPVNRSFMHLHLGFDGAGEAVLNLTRGPRSRATVYSVASWRCAALSCAQHQIVSQRVYGALRCLAQELPAVTQRTCELQNRWWTP